MKKIHIISILLIGAAVALLIAASDDLSTYNTFADAKRTGSKVKVVGTLAKDKEMHYDPEEDPNYFSFYMVDGEGDESKVVLLKAKPTDFEMSEQIVVTGKWTEEAFVASEILLKCPSKYKNEEVFLREETVN